MPLLFSDSEGVRTLDPQLRRLFEEKYLNAYISISCKVAKNVKVFVLLRVSAFFNTHHHHLRLACKALFSSLV